EFIASFVFAACVLRLSKKFIAPRLIVGGGLVLARSYARGGVGGGDRWEDLYCGFGRVFFAFVCGVFLFRMWRSSNQKREQIKLGPMIALALVVVLLCPVPRAANWLYDSLAV